MKKFLKNSLKRAVDVFFACLPPGVVSDTIMFSILNRKQALKYNNRTIYFSTPNRLSAYRARTLLDKEPETLRWIDEFEEGEVLWDVGANIGLYSIYAAAFKRSKVVAFEPSVFNQSLLVKNIALNGLESEVAVVGNPLGNIDGLSIFSYGSEELAGALNSFNTDVSWDGNRLESVLDSKMLGFSADFLCGHQLIPEPTHIKIDVDGAEHFVLEGMIRTLSKVKSVLVEVNPNFVEQHEVVAEILSGQGMRLVYDDLNNFNREIGHGFELVHNQIWSKA